MVARRAARLQSIQAVDVDEAAEPQGKICFTCECKEGDPETDIPVPEGENAQPIVIGPTGLCYFCYVAFVILANYFDLEDRPAISRRWQRRVLSLELAHLCWIGALPEAQRAARLPS